MMCRTMRATDQRRRGIALSIVLAGLFLMCPTPVSALNPALDVSQYAHTAWKIRDGFIKGSIYAMAQTADGYLWLGTELGLYRFDGVRNVLWTPPGGEQLPSNNIGSLLAARDGTLWIATTKGLASWKNGKLTHYPELEGQDVIRMLEDREGTVWIGSILLPSSGKLCAIRGGNPQCYGEDGSFGLGVLGLFEDSKGNLWVGTGTGLWRWKPGPPKFYSLPELGGIRALEEDVDGALLVGWKGGIWRFIDGKTEAYPLPRGLQPFTATNLLRDHDGGLWIATIDKGLLHVHQGRTDVFAQTDGLSSNGVTSLFEDREGTIWAGTFDGLDRFREFAVTTYGAKQGMPSAFVSSVLDGEDGGLWLGGIGALYRWKNGEFGAYNKGDGKLNGASPMSLFRDAHGKVWVSTSKGVGYIENGRFIPSGISEQKVYSFAEDNDGNLWMANANDVGLIRLSAQSEIQKIPWAELGHKDYGHVLAIDPFKEGLWIGFEKGGVSYFADGRVRVTYTAADGLGTGRVNRLRFLSLGWLWAATEGGLSRIKDGHVATLTSKNGLPCDTVHWSMEDDDHFVWVNMPCGLVRIARDELNSWVDAVAKDKDAKPTIQLTVFDISEGARGRTSPGYQPQVTKSADGKLWFTGYDGVGVIDPKHLPFNKLPPPVQVAQITADHKVYDTSAGASGHLRLPPLIRDLEIDYTALSLVVPERVQFRYKLEGWEDDWQEAGNRRQAFYTNLRPGQYRFRVAACNNSGVWNEAGAAFDFSIAPAYYQTRWFQFLCVLGAILVGWELYRLRVRRVVGAISARFDERLAERARVARELHDTLLQTVMGSKYVVDGVLLDPSNDPLRMRRALEKLSGSLDLATHEARNAVNTLRASTVQKNDLAEALREAIEDCRRDPSMEASLYLSGDAKDMHPVVREEVYRIGLEAVRNACKHSQTARLEVSLSYGRDLTLCVSDIGIGIDPRVVDKGKEGHVGLHSMRERAARIGGKLTMVSSQASGTKITVVVPGNHIFRKPGASLLEKLREIVTGQDRPFNSN